MPWRPAGLHRDAGSGIAYGGQPIRPQATPQEHYWRRQRAELFAGATLVFNPVLGVPAGPTVPYSASTGPQGTGERWTVDTVQVNTPQQYGQPPQVIQQVGAQGTGTTSLSPPPVVAQVWHNYAGTPWTAGRLLGQTTAGGTDNISVGDVDVVAGEVITVVWYGFFFAFIVQELPAGWFAVRGTKTVLSPV